MYDMEWKQSLWRQSGAHYNVRKGGRRKRQADNFEVDASKRQTARLPIYLASLENQYGNVEFSRMQDGTMAVSFARKAEYREPVFHRQEEKLNLNQAGQERVGGGMKHLYGERDNSMGAEAFLLSPDKGPEGNVKRLTRNLKQMAESMAALLLPLEQGVMPKGLEGQLSFSLTQTARHAAEQQREEEMDKKEKTRGSLWSLRKIYDGNESEEEAEEEADEENSDT